MAASNPTNAIIVTDDGRHRVRAGKGVFNFLGEALDRAEDVYDDLIHPDLDSGAGTGASGSTGSLPTWAPYAGAAVVAYLLLRR